MTSGSLVSAGVAKSNNNSYFWGNVISSNLSATKTITFYTTVGGIVNSDGCTANQNEEFQASYNSPQFKAHKLKGVPNSVGPRASGSWSP